MYFLEDIISGLNMIDTGDSPQLYQPLKSKNIYVTNLIYLTKHQIYWQSHTKTNRVLKA